MTKSEQIKFIENATKSILEDFLVAMSVGNIPEEWDGFELRWYIRDKASEFVFSDMRGKKSKRYKEYENTMIVNNL